MHQHQPVPTTTTSASVSISEAQAEFSNLSYEISNTPASMGIDDSYEKNFANLRDVEKGAEDENDNYLENILRGRAHADSEAGLHPKEVGIIWENLRTSTIQDTTSKKDFLNVRSIRDKLLGRCSNGREVELIHNSSGVVKPGEMLLVLGRTNSGASAFLKTITNQQTKILKTEGVIQYGLLDHKTFFKKYPSEVMYNQEDDVHYASLTVRQTLQFAIEMRIPGSLPSGLSDGQFKEMVMRTLLKMFNLEHVADMPVGGEAIRGISGGEKKRLSIAEMMVTSAAICGWDNSTRGLDSSNALEFVKCLRILTNLYKTSVVVSLSQANENMYQHFDKVLVMEEGRQLYFGSKQDAVAYFESLGFKRQMRQASADFLVSCTDPIIRHLDPQNLSYDSQSLEILFEKSPESKQRSVAISSYREQLLAQKEKWRYFETAVQNSKHRHTAKRSVYIMPFYRQVWVLMRRQFLIRWQDKLSLVMSLFTTIVVALLLGSLWFDLPHSLSGAFTRSGLLFLLLVYNGFRAFAELGTIFGRPIVKKHRAYTLHRLSAMWTAQLLVDITFISFDVAIYSIIIYFMCGLAREAGAFFIFLTTTFISYMAMTLLFRTVACVCSSIDTAIRFSAPLMVLLLLTSGYLIEYSDEKPWLRWIFYINPISLGYSVLMINEFTRIDLSCTGSNLVPYGAGYTSIENRVCNYPEAQNGLDLVRGLDYIHYGFEYKSSELWRNWCLILAFIAFLFALNLILGELVTFDGGEVDIAKTAPQQNAVGCSAIASAKARSEASGEAPLDPNYRTAGVLTWENLSYDVEGSRGQLRLLDNICGIIKPGELIALMGVSGAGKTTLLDVLASRKNIGVVNGDVLVDGRPRDAGFQRSISYAEQDDIHEPTQTVREALRFSADLRQEYNIPQTEKYAYVEEVLELLELTSIADVAIGSPGTGLGLEHRKRVTIAVEVAARPKLLLFLDEPTSGLDSQSAYNVVRLLRRLSSAGQAILCTIHQPNSTLFQNFDKLLLLQRKGRCVYFGDIGPAASTVLRYFHDHGAICSPEDNPPDWLLSTIGSQQNGAKHDWPAKWSNSLQFNRLREEISQIKASRHASEIDHAAIVERNSYATPIWHQLKIVHKRTHLSLWRTPEYGITRLFLHIAISILSGLSFLLVGDSRSALQSRIFIIFQVSILPTIILTHVEPKYAAARLIFYRESASKMYGQFSFASGLVAAEMPYSVVCATAFFVPFYFMTGFQTAVNRAGYQFLMVLITEMFSVTLGQTIAALTPTNTISSLLNPFLVVTMNLFCGVAVPRPVIPRFYRVWLYPLNPLTRLIGGMAVAEIHGLNVTCKPSEYIRFNSPPGQDCGAYMSKFFASGGPGYLAQNATNVCEYCSYKVGDEFLSTLQLNFDNRWRDLGIFAVYVGTNVMLLLIGSRYLFFNRR